MCTHASIYIWIIDIYPYMDFFFFLKPNQTRPGVVEKLPSGCRERLTQTPGHQGVSERAGCRLLGRRGSWRG